MRNRLSSFFALAAAVALAATAPAMIAQTSRNAGAKGTAGARTPGPLLPDGHPDLQGIWSFATLTPFERPGAAGEKQELSDTEVEEFVSQSLTAQNKDRRDGGAAADVERAYNDFWWDYGKTALKQPSLVVDPAIGRVPALTAAAQARLAAARGRGNLRDNVEERPVAERCILGFNSGPPMVPSAYNNNVQLVQTKDRIVILNEMVHSARVVSLTRRSHMPPSFRFLTGDSIGRWEGSTLIVDTTNFLRAGMIRGSSPSLHLIERFSRPDASTLLYQFTVDDPSTWTQKWTASVPMTMSDEPIYEYACHEGNVGLADVLKGARYEEQQAAGTHR
jgi:hypothetical protein